MFEVGLGPICCLSLLHQNEEPEDHSFLVVFVIGQLHICPLKRLGDPLLGYLPSATIEFPWFPRLGWLGRLSSNWGLSRA